MEIVQIPITAATTKFPKTVQIVNLPEYRLVIDKNLAIWNFAAALANEIRQVLTQMKVTTIRPTVLCQTIQIMVMAVVVAEPVVLAAAQEV